MSEPLPPLTPDTAAQIARQDPVLSQNTEPGFANTYGPGSNVPEGRWALAVPAAAMSAAGLYWLYRKYQQDKLEKEKKAAVDWQAVRAQLPGLHAPDLLLGGAAGAGAGMLYDYLRGSEKKKRFATALRRILTGAALGAGATNLVGDRFRRYVTNSVVPAGYDSGNIISQLKPRSWQHVYDAAIKDKPSYDPAKVKEFVEQFRNTEVGQRVLAARREIERIGQGVNSYNPQTSVWQRNPDKTYSINEKNKDYIRNLVSIYFPSRLAPNSVMRADELQATIPNRKDISGLFLDPKSSLDFVNKLDLDGQLQTDLFGTHALLGAQQLVAQQRGADVAGMSLDRHDVTPSNSGLAALRQNITSGKIFNPAWRAGNADGVYGRGQTNSQVMFGTLGRMAWDRLLRKENPWVAQKFKFTPAEGPAGDPEYGLQLLRQDNTPVFSRPVTRDVLYDYLNQAQTTDTVPEIK
jgi:hypothetical protein